MTLRIRSNTLGGLAVLVLAVGLLAGCSSTSSYSGSTTTAATSAAPVSSASASVPIAGAGAPKVVQSAAADGKTMTLTAGAFDPSTVTIPVNSTVTITNGGDAEADVIVGTEAPFTLAKGESKIFQFPAAGPFDVGAIKGTARGTITVS